jgi:hypothetical protein
MSSEVLLLEKSEVIATLTLNRPDAMNALSRALRDAIAHAFREIQADPAIRVASAPASISRSWGRVIRSNWPTQPRAVSSTRSRPSKGPSSPRSTATPSRAGSSWLWPVT